MDDLDAPVDDSLDDIPTRYADYGGLAPGDPGFYDSRMNPTELNVIMSENLKSQNADKLDFPSVDSDGNIRPALGVSSSDEEEKLSEEKFVRRVKRRTFRRRVRMERHWRGHDTVWSVEDME